jgi:hypothetical protein
MVVRPSAFLSLHFMAGAADSSLMLILRRTSMATINPE